MLFDINRFHFFVLLTWQFAIFFASQQIFPIFLNYVPEWQCGDGPIGKNCAEYDRCGGNVTFIGKVYDSAALEYGWICSNNYIGTTLLPQAQFLGVLLGTFSFGTVSDIFGRKPIAIIAMSLGLTMNFITGLASSWKIFLVIRFFVGLSVGGTLVVVCTFVMEMLLPQQRMALRAFFNWGVARLIMTLICLALPEWRQSSFACALAALPALFILIFIFPESPTWLHNKGRLDDMRKSEMHIAKWAGVEYQPIEHEKVEHNKTVCELLTSCNLLRRLVVLWLMWFVASICGYATDLNSNTISGDFFLNQILFSILIAASKIALVIFDSNVPAFSRRSLHQGAQSIVCVCFLILTVLTIKEYRGTVILIVSLIGTVFIEYTWDACYLCAVESMETAYRASATGTCSLMARVGAFIAPYLNQATSVWPPALYLTVVVLGTVNLGMSYFFLVETKGINLDKVKIPDDDAEDQLIEATPMVEQPVQEKSNE
ncbi:unnamed protein product [Auanema sp. JU1783]|nr:unnamed protein product [Auanema sp. JU1783]